MRELILIHPVPQGTKSPTFTDEIGREKLGDLLKVARFGPAFLISTLGF